MSSLLKMAEEYVAREDAWPMHLCIRTRAILSLKSSPQVSQQRIYNFKLGRYVTLPAGGSISKAWHMHLSNCFLELVNDREMYVTV